MTDEKKRKGYGAKVDFELGNPNPDENNNDADGMDILDHEYGQGKDYIPIDDPQLTPGDLDAMELKYDEEAQKEREDLIERGEDAEKRMSEKNEGVERVQREYVEKEPMPEFKGVDENKGLDRALTVGSVAGKVSGTVSTAFDAATKYMGEIRKLTNTFLSGNPMSSASRLLSSTVQGFDGIYRKLDAAAKNYGIDINADKDIIKETALGKQYYLQRDKAERTAEYLMQTFNDELKKVVGPNGNVDDLTFSQLDGVYKRMEVMLKDDVGRIKGKMRSGTPISMDERVLMDTYRNMTKQYLDYARSEKREVKGLESDIERGQENKRKYDDIKRLFEEYRASKDESFTAEGDPNTSKLMNYIMNTVLGVESVDRRKGPGGYFTPVMIYDALIRSRQNYYEEKERGNDENAARWAKIHNTLVDWRVKTGIKKPKKPVKDAPGAGPEVPGGGGGTFVPPEFDPVEFGKMAREYNAIYSQSNVPVPTYADHLMSQFGFPSIEGVRDNAYLDMCDELADVFLDLAAHRAKYIEFAKRKGGLSDADKRMFMDRDAILLQKIQKGLDEIKGYGDPRFDPLYEMEQGRKDGDERFNGVPLNDAEFDKAWELIEPELLIPPDLPPNYEEKAKEFLNKVWKNMFKSKTAEDLIKSVDMYNEAVSRMIGEYVEDESYDDQDEEEDDENGGGGLGGESGGELFEEQNDDTFEEQNDDTFEEQNDEEQASPNGTYDDVINTYQHARMSTYIGNTLKALIEKNKTTYHPLMRSANSFRNLANVAKTAGIPPEEFGEFCEKIAEKKKEYDKLIRSRNPERKKLGDKKRKEIVKDITAFAKKVNQTLNGKSGFESPKLDKELYEFYGEKIGRRNKRNNEFMTKPRWAEAKMETIISSIESKLNEGRYMRYRGEDIYRATLAQLRKVIDELPEGDARKQAFMDILDYIDDRFVIRTGENGVRTLGKRFEAEYYKGGNGGADQPKKKPLVFETFWNDFQNRLRALSYKGDEGLFKDVVDRVRADYEEPTKVWRMLAKYVESIPELAEQQELIERMAKNEEVFDEFERKLQERKKEKIPVV